MFIPFKQTFWDGLIFRGELKAWMYLADLRWHDVCDIWSNDIKSCYMVKIIEIQVFRNGLWQSHSFFKNYQMIDFYF